MQTKMWAIVTPNGRLVTHTVQRSRIKAIQKFGVIYPPWRHWQDKGYRCVRVTVTVEEKII